MRRLLASSVVAAFALAFPSAAHADDTAAALHMPEAADAPKPTSTWYGNQTLVTDGVATGLFAIGLSSKTRTGVAGFGLGTYALGAPIVHFVHGNVGRGFGDLGMRLGAPLVTGFAGLLVGVATIPVKPLTPSDSSGSAGIGDNGQKSVDHVATFAAVGVATGMVVASVIDATLLAKEKEAPKTTARSSIQPTVSVDARGASAGVVGQF